MKLYLYGGLLLAVALAIWLFADWQRAAELAKINAQNAAAIAAAAKTYANKEAAWQAQLDAAQQTHDQEKTDLDGTIADLQQRLHDYESRPGPVPRPAPSPAQPSGPSGVSSGSQCPRQDPEVEAAIAAVMVAAAHDAERLDQCRLAWPDPRTISDRSPRTPDSRP